MKSWYSIKAQAGESAEISIFDEIGYWGVTAKQFIGDLKGITAPTIKLAINSPGGAVFDALAIYNALRQHDSEIEVTVMGVAASAASIIAMAGDKIIMPENAFMMIHNPLNFAYGNAEDLREMADVLDKIGASLIGIYAKRTGMGDDEIKALLDAETWLNAEDAVSKGFADQMSPNMKVAASYDPERLPENVRNAIIQTTITTTTWTEDSESEDETEDPETPGPETPDPEEGDDTPPPAPAPMQNSERELAGRIIALAAEAGIAAMADAFILDAAIKNVSDAEVAVAEAKEIIAVCAAAKMPDIAAGLVKARIPLASVRQRIIDAKAELDRLTQTNHIIPSNPQPVNVWAKVLSSHRQTKE